MFKKSLGYIILFNMIFLHCSFAIAQIVEDDLANQAFNGQNLSKPTFKKEIIEDEYFLGLKGQNFAKPVYQKVILEDEIVKNNLDIQTSIKQAVHYRLIDENAEIVKISVCPLNLITTKDGLKLGQNVEFKVLKDVYKNGQVFIKKDTPVSAYIELISQADRFGDPDEIELGRFTTKDVKDNPVELSGLVKKQGANRAKWAKPLFYAGYSVPVFGTPLLLCYFVKGGKTKIKPEENFELYYEGLSLFRLFLFD